MLNRGRVHVRGLRAGGTRRRDRGEEGGICATPRPVLYLALGDSTGVGVGAGHGGYAARLYSRIERARPGSRLINLCAAGAATADLLNGQVERVIEARPTLVTMGVGANDLIRGVTAEKFARNFVVKLRQQTNVPVVVMNIPDMSLAPAVPAYMRDRARRHIRIFNERIAEVAGRYDLPVVDLFGRSPDGSFSVNWKKERTIRCQVLAALALRRRGRGPERDGTSQSYM